MARTALAPSPGPAHRRSMTPRSRGRAQGLAGAVDSCGNKEKSNQRGGGRAAQRERGVLVATSEDTTVAFYDRLTDCGFRVWVVIQHTAPSWLDLSTHACGETCCEHHTERHRLRLRMERPHVSSGGGAHSAQRTRPPSTEAGGAPSQRGAARVSRQRRHMGSAASEPARSVLRWHVGLSTSAMNQHTRDGGHGSGARGRRRCTNTGNRVSER